MGSGASYNKNSEGSSNGSSIVQRNTEEVEVSLSPLNDGESRKWVFSSVRLENESIVVFDEGKVESTLSIPLSEVPHILKIVEESNEKVSTLCVTGTSKSFWVRMNAKYEESWVNRLREEMIKRSVSKESDLSKGLKNMIDQFSEMIDANVIPDAVAVPLDNGANLAITPPPMNIVILVVGTRGDVQPFAYLGQALQNDGHRVRLATHAEYRQDVINKAGLEYYPLAGDPRKLSEYMVKTAGRLMPDLLNKEERTAIPEKMKMLEEITISCFPACTAPDPEDPESKPFVADAIISNPVSYGHIHCAEALCVPLHIMFPQPWSPTKTFPHPLSNMGFASSWSLKNYYSYKVVDEFMWLGLGSIINNFRKTHLKLRPIRTGEHGDALLNDNKVPISHMWSPSFVPKCKDWPAYVDVVGEFRPAKTSNNTSAPYQPVAELAAFLAEGERPIYIGFGSMVIEDASSLVEIIKSAAKETGCRVLLQSGWTKYGGDNEMISDNVMVIGAMPHDFLFANVTGVCHHGGAGTTSAGLRTGNPTFICPFFGDQHFWAEMVHRSGSGPAGCPIKQLTVDKLVEAFRFMRLEETQKCARELGDKMAAEDGVTKGIESFYNNLPTSNMICEVSVFNNRQSKVARVFCGTCGLKLCTEADRVIHRASSGREDHVRLPFRPSRWGVVAPDSVLDGISQGFGVAASEMAGGLYDLFAKPIHGGLKGGARGAAVGMATGAINLFARPALGGKVLIERVYTGTKGALVGGTDINAAATVEANLLKKNTTHTSFVKQSTSGDEADEDSSIKIKTFSSKSESELVVQKGYSPALDINDASEDIQRIERAYEAAMEFLQFWNKIDTDGNRTVDAKELTVFLGGKHR